MSENHGEKDYFRDTWVRYLGYTNEVGESFRALVPRWVVRASYKVAFTYVLADTVHKTWNEFKKEGLRKKVAVEAGDALIWQTLASVIIPGFTINRICAYSHKPLARRFPQYSPRTRALMTVGIGLVSIPFIVYPIDAGTSVLMELTYRRWVK